VSNTGLYAALGVVAALALTPVRVPDPPFASAVFADGRILDARVATDGQWRLPPGQVPPRFERALLTAEDSRFYVHPGVDPLAIGRAAWGNLLAGEVTSGGSTLTMQLQRLASDHPERNILQKADEAWHALRLELSLAKPDILRSYAANAPFGGNVVGLEAASWRYYGRPAGELSWAQAATLAVLPNEPGLVHPGRHRAALKRKRDRVLHALESSGVLDEIELELALSESLPARPIPFEHLSHHVLASLPRGESLYSTLDAELQQLVLHRAQSHLHSQVSGGIHHAAVVVLDVDSGQVVAYVGNAGQRGPGDAVDVARARRSSGSTLKPFLYEALLASGGQTPHAWVRDVPFRAEGFAPENFDRVFEGAIPASRALERSRNVPAVHMLRAYGVDAFLHDLRDRGLTTLDRSADDYGLSLILGGGEVTLWDLAQAYRELGLQALERAEMALPTMDQHASPESAPLVGDAGAAWWTLEALREVARPGAYGTSRSIAGPSGVAWKTGTSMGFRDAWAVGVSRSHVVAVWVGNASGEGRAGLIGSRAAGPLLFDVFGLLPGQGEVPEPAGLVPVDICPVTGFRAGPHCGDPVVERLPLASLKSPVCPHCETGYCAGDCTERRHLACAEGLELQRVRQTVLPPDMAWFARGQPHVPRALPWADACHDDVAPPVIVWPAPGTRVAVGTGKEAGLVGQASPATRDDTLYWHLDGTWLGATNTLHHMELPAGPGEHVLAVVGPDGARAETTFEVVSESRP